MGTWFDGSATSSHGVGINLDRIELYGSGVADNQEDRFSTVSFYLDDAVIGRLGMRPQGDIICGGMKLQPCLKTSLA